MQFTDALQRILIIEKYPQRIVSLVPSLTETLFHLGLEKRIVGVTDFCVHPLHFRATKTLVGGTKKPKIDRIKSLNPDFILCNKEENTLETVLALEKVAPLYVTDVSSFDDTIQLIKKLGEMLGKRTEAEVLTEKINRKHTDFLKYIENKRPIKTAYFIWKNPWLVAGNGTFIHDMLRINRLENVFANRERYPEVSIKHLKLQGNPELLLFSSEPYHFTEEDAFEVLRENEKILSIFVDGQYFTWYGSRLLSAFDYFTTLQEKISTYEA